MKKHKYTRPLIAIKGSDPSKEKVAATPAWNNLRFAILEARTDLDKLLKTEGL